MRPSPAWSEFFGLHWDYETMVRENGVVNERIAAAAKAAGATKFVLLSVASSVKWAYGGSLEGYIDGKQEAETAELNAKLEAESEARRDLAAKLEEATKLLQAGQYGQGGGGTEPAQPPALS